MSHEGRPPEAPTSAAGDSIILHVPACVQRISSRRRVLSRLRALARRRSRGLPELEAAPLKLQVEENPNWPAAEEPFGIGRSLEIQDWSDESELFSNLLEDAGGESVLSISAAASASEPVQEIAPEPSEDPDSAIIHQLEEDNRDLRAALCRLIRIAEENNAALRLLEEENEELSTLVHRLTTGQTAVARRQTPDASCGNGIRPPLPLTLPHLASGVCRLASGMWLKRRLDRRCI